MARLMCECRIEYSIENFSPNDVVFDIGIIEYFVYVT